MPPNTQIPQSNFAYDQTWQNSQAIHPSMRYGPQSYNTPTSSNMGASRDGYTADAMQGFQAPQNGAAASGGGGPGFSGMQDWFGGTNAAGESQMGYVPAGLGVAQFGLNAYLGMKNYGLAKDQLKFEKEAFNFNKDTTMANMREQSKSVNAALSDRQRARNIANPGQAMATDEYMSQYGASGNV